MRISHVKSLLSTRIERRDLHSGVRDHRLVCTTACSYLKPWVAREQKVEIAVRARRYWPMTEPHAWTMSCARVAYCWAYTCKLLRRAKKLHIQSRSNAIGVAPCGTSFKDSDGLVIVPCLHLEATSHGQASTSPSITLWVAFARPYFAYGFIANSSSYLHVSGGARRVGDTCMDFRCHWDSGVGNHNRSG